MLTLSISFALLAAAAATSRSFSLLAGEEAWRTTRRVSPDSRPAAPSASSCVNSERTPASPTKDRVRAVPVALAEDMVLKEDAARSTPSFDLEACGEVGWEVEAFKAFEPSMCISNELHQNNRNQPHTHVSTNEHVALIQRERERERERETERERQRDRERD